MLNAKGEPATTPAAVSNDANQQRIHELEQDLSADQRQSQQQQQVQKEGAAGPATGNASSMQANGATPAAQTPPPVQPPRDPIADAEKALAFKARFASNLIGPSKLHPRRQQPPRLRLLIPSRSNLLRHRPPLPAANTRRKSTSTRRMAAPM